MEFGEQKEKRNQDVLTITFLAQLLQHFHKAKLFAKPFVHILINIKQGIIVYHHLLIHDNSLLHSEHVDAGKANMQNQGAFKTLELPGQVLESTVLPVTFHQLMSETVGFHNHLADVIRQLLDRIFDGAKGGLNAWRLKLWRTTDNR
jgi:hypothetical protein